MCVECRVLGTAFCEDLLKRCKAQRDKNGWLLIEAAWAKVVAELEGVFAGALAGYWLRQQYQQQRRNSPYGCGS